MQNKRKLHNMKKRIRVFLVCIVIIIIMCACLFLIQNPQYLKCFVIERGSWAESPATDDQRSTMWPLFTTLIITILGSLISTYVFLKASLDRMVDEKTYYRKVVDAYRRGIMGMFLAYSFGCLLLSFVIAMLYTSYYFLGKRTVGWIRMAIGSGYMICIPASGFFLYKCIYTEKEIHKAAEKSIKKLNAWLSASGSTGIQENIARSRGCFAGEGSGKDLSERFQLQNIYEGDVDAFIEQFTNWEKFLLLMVDDKKQDNKQQAGRLAGIREAVLRGEEVRTATKSEVSDAKGHGWRTLTFRNLEYKTGLLATGEEDFLEIYEKLSEFRDLLRVYKETSENAEMDQLQLVSVAGELTMTFAIFVRQLSLKYLKNIPRIDLFCPSGKFEYADFYNVRIENSSFRFSLFAHTVFARTKMKNTNMGWSKFDGTEFYSADIRNCSWNNCLFVRCNLKESLWNDADLTGSNFLEGFIQNAVFENVVLSNMEFVNTGIDNTIFRSCKLSSVVFQNIKDHKLCKCNFEKTDLKDIRFLVESVPKTVWGLDFPEKEWFVQLDQWFYSKKKPERNSLPQIPELKINYFRTLCVRKNGISKKSYEEWSFWKRLRKLCFYNMQESVFADAMMTGICFCRMNFEQSNFRNAQMNESCLMAVNMSGCVMNGVGLREAVIGGCYLESVVLEDAVLYHMHCWLSNFQDSDLTNLHASKSVITGCTFGRSDCSRIDLTKAQVSFASFRDSILNSAELTNADFIDVILDNCIAEEMLSAYTRFYRCSFTNALLRWSSFNYTVFEQCCFKLANFSDSTVLGADFRACDFQDANFRGTTFIEVVFENNKNISTDIFSGCRFFDVDFRGNDAQWKNLLEQNGKEVEG